MWLSRANIAYVGPWSKTVVNCRNRARIRRAYTCVCVQKPFKNISICDWQQYVVEISMVMFVRSQSVSGPIEIWSSFPRTAELVQSMFVVELPISWEIWSDTRPGLLLQPWCQRSLTLASRQGNCYRTFSFKAVMSTYLGVKMSDDQEGRDRTPESRSPCIAEIGSSWFAEWRCCLQGRNVTNICQGVSWCKM
jgi:hypothetical protein